MKIRGNSPVFGLGILIVTSVGKVEVILLLGFCELMITFRRK